MLDIYIILYIILSVRDNLKTLKTEDTQMIKRTYNLSSIMRNAWKLFDETTDTFAECLVKAWADAKAFVNAIQQNFITEEVHTWYGWKELGYEVIHESKNVFQITVNDPKTKSGKRILSYFTKSQVTPIGTQD